MLLIVLNLNTSYCFHFCRGKKDTSEKMDEVGPSQKKNEEQVQIMWLNKLPPGVKIPLTAQQMAKVAKMVKLIKIYSTYKHLPVML